MFYCTNTECAIHQKKKAFPAMMECPMCDSPLQRLVEYSELDRKVIEEYPYVLAYPYKRMIEEIESRNKLELLAYTFLNGLKLLGLELASEYFQSSLKSAKLNELFRSNLFQPSFGNWNAFLREAISVFEAQRHALIFPELTEAYKRIELDKKAPKYKSETPYTNEEGKIAWKKSELTAIGSLINFRNRFLGHGVPLSKDEYTSLYDEVRPIFDDFMKALECTSHFQLIKSETSGNYLLKGCTIELLESNSVKTPTEDSTISLKATDGRILNLLPFYILPKQHISGADDRAEVLVYEQSTGQRIVFYSPESIKAEESGHVLERLRLLLSDKEMENPCSIEDFNKDYLLQWINVHNDKILEGLWKEKKVIQGIYQQRLDAETALMTWIGAQASLFVLAAEAGSGKTNVLAQALELYKRAGFTSVLIRANRCASTSIEDELRKVCNAPEELDLAHYLDNEYHQTNPIVLLIDGGNEHHHPGDFFDGILTFLKRIKPGHIKVVLSWRVSSLDDLPAIPEDLEYLVYPAGDHEHHRYLAKCAYRLFGLNKIELEGAWNAYVNAKISLFKPRFNFDELLLTDSTLADELSNPLLLRLFLELHHQKPIPKKDKGFIHLWATWWNSIVYEPHQATFLRHLADYMLDQKRLNLTLDELFDNPELGASVKNIQIDSPYRQLLMKGVLSQYFREDSLYVSFTMEAAMNYVASLGLSDQTVRSKIGESWMWTEPMRYFLWDKVHSSDDPILFELIDEECLPDGLVAFGLAQYIFSHGIAEALDRLLVNPTPADWNILEATYQVIRDVRPDTSTSIADGILQYSQDRMIDFNKRLVLTLLSKGSKGLVDEFYQKHFRDFEPEHLEEAIALARYFEKYGQSRSAYTLLLDFVEADFPVSKKTFELYEVFVGICNELGRYTESWTIIDRWESELRQHFGTNPKDQATLFTQRGRVKERLALLNEAQRYYQDALSLNEQMFGPFHEGTLSNIVDVGDVKRELGLYQEALEYYQIQLDRNIKIFGESHPNVATGLNRIGDIFRTKGEYDKALEYFERAIVIYKQYYGKSHPVVARSLINIGEIFQTIGEYDKSLEYFERAIVIYKQNYGESHPNVADNLGRIGGIFETKGEYNKALGYFEKDLKISIEFYGQSHPNVALVLNRIGGIYETICEYDKALGYFEKDLKISIEFYGDSHPNVALTLNSIGVIHEAKGKYENAIRYYMTALEICKDYYGENHRITAAIKRNVGYTYLLLNRVDEAELFLKDAEETLVHFNIENDPLLARVYLRIALMLRLKTLFKEAIKEVDKSISMFEARFGSKSIYAADAYFEKAMIYQSMGDTNHAATWFRKCIEVRTDVLGVDHPETEKAILQLKTINQL